MLTNCIEPLQIQNSLQHLLLRFDVAAGPNLSASEKLELHQYRHQFVAQITKLSLL
jgi:hypothetical protein